MPTAVLVDYIDQHRQKFGVEPICEALTNAGTKIAPSTYHAPKTAEDQGPSVRAISDAKTTEVIEQVHAQNYGGYGIRNVHAELNRQGHPVARGTMQRLMKAAGLRGISRAKGPRTTIPGTGRNTRPDLVSGRSPRRHPMSHGSRTSRTAGPSPAESTRRCDRRVLAADRGLAAVEESADRSGT